MSSNIEPYITRNPGDLWTAEDWNDVQKKIKEDIGKQIKAAVEEIKSVPHADNSDKLENQSADELTQAILEKVRQDLPKRTGYRKLFKRLEPNKENVIEHKLGSYPLVDIYQLMPFSAICSEDDEKNKDDDTYFYLYHSGEQSVSFTPPGGARVSVVNEPTSGPAFRIPFTDLLALYEVEYTDTTTLSDLETDFWKAFFAEPNDRFSDDDYCHSPWFDRCCGENRTVGQLKRGGDWNDKDMLFKVMPRKTVNTNVEATPKDIRVNQYSFDELGITSVSTATGPAGADIRVMVLLKV